MFRGRVPTRERERPAVVRKEAVIIEAKESEGGAIVKEGFRNPVRNNKCGDPRARRAEGGPRVQSEGVGAASDDNYIL